nr:uncharacterized protein LOC106731629 [Pelodiscus sinensis]|eukprot:XP_014426478.1 uncharacterized protein LOC106731629 [Pelodiscus sinensis]
MLDVLACPQYPLPLPRGQAQSAVPCICRGVSAPGPRTLLMVHSHRNKRLEQPLKERQAGTVQLHRHPGPPALCHPLARRHPLVPLHCPAGSCEGLSRPAMLLLGCSSKLWLLDTLPVTRICPRSRERTGKVPRWLLGHIWGWGEGPSLGRAAVCGSLRLAGGRLGRLSWMHRGSTIPQPVTILRAIPAVPWGPRLDPPTRACSPPASPWLPTANACGGLGPGPCRERPRVRGQRHRQPWQHTAAVHLSRAGKAKPQPSQCRGEATWLPLQNRHTPGGLLAGPHTRAPQCLLGSRWSHLPPSIAPVKGLGLPTFSLLPGGFPPPYWDAGLPCARTELQQLGAPLCPPG